MSIYEGKYKIIFPDNIEFIVNAREINKSPKLRSLFMIPCNNKFKEEIVINDIDYKIFSYIISFIKHMINDEENYKQKIEETVNSMDGNELIDFTKVADFFGMTEFIDIVENRFKKLLETNDLQSIRKFT